jgi:hypothetical protein
MSIACNHSRISHSTLFKNYKEIQSGKQMCKYKYTNLKSQKFTVSILVERKPTANTYGDITKPKSEEFQE